MNRLKVKLLDELMDHLSDSQGSDLKGLMDESKNPMENEMGEDGKPKGLKIESVEIMGKKPEIEDVALNDNKEKGDSLGSLIGYPGEPKPKNPLPKPMYPKPTAMNEGMGEDEMTDDELKELLKRHMG